eukprot:scaffold1671_cov344-Pavlova_lutheri.AAC.25
MVSFPVLQMELLGSGLRLAHPIQHRHARLLDLVTQVDPSGPPPELQGAPQTLRKIPPRVLGGRHRGPKCAADAYCGIDEWTRRTSLTWSTPSTPNVKEVVVEIQINKKGVELPPRQWQAWPWRRPTRGVALENKDTVGFRPPRRGAVIATRIQHREIRPSTKRGGILTRATLQAEPWRIRSKKDKTRRGQERSLQRLPIQAIRCQGFFTRGSSFPTNHGAKEQESCSHGHPFLRNQNVSISLSALQQQVGWILPL